MAVALALLGLPAAFADGWYEAKTQHITVLTDISEKRARELALRFEQTRALTGQVISRDKVSVAQPLDIFAFKDPADYRRNVPGAVGERSVALVAGGERNYLVFGPTLSATPEAELATQWQRGAGDLTRLFLEGSYPPAQAWFDEGLAQYVAGIRLHGDATWGTDPGVARGTPFIALLGSQSWMPLPALLSYNPPPNGEPTPLFLAESWLLVHSMLAAGSEQTMESCGKYLYLVRSQGVAAPEAWQQAFGATLAESEAKLHAYFEAVRAPIQAAVVEPEPSKAKVFPAQAGPVRHQAPPLGADDVSILITKLDPVEARVRVGELALHVPEQRSRALADLQNVEEQFPKIWQVHRALGFSAMQVRDWDLAQRDFSQAAQSSPTDPWTRFYMALLRYRYSADKGAPLQNPGIIQQDLYAALSAYAQFPDALDMLAQAYTAGYQGTRAVESARAAIKQAPRNQAYVLHLGQALTISEKWDEAQQVFERLVRTAPGPVAAEARKWLSDLPIRKKYGNALAQQGKGVVDLTGKGKAAAPDPMEVTAEDEAEDARREAAAHPKADPRPLQFVKGKLLRVECAKASATLLVSANGKQWRMHVADVTSVVLVGADGFSCDWRDRSVFVNYRLKAALEGDVSSLELE